MKIKDFVAFLSQFDPEQTILCADYYYDCLVGFTPCEAIDLSKYIAPAENVLYREHYGDVLLLDFKGLSLS